MTDAELQTVRDKLNPYFVPFAQKPKNYKVSNSKKSQPDMWVKDVSKSIVLQVCRRHEAAPSPAPACLDHSYPLCVCSVPLPIPIACIPLVYGTTACVWCASGTGCAVLAAAVPIGLLSRLLQALGVTIKSVYVLSLCPQHLSCVYLLNTHDGSCSCWHEAMLVCHVL